MRTTTTRNTLTTHTSSNTAGFPPAPSEAHQRSDREKPEQRQCRIEASTRNPCEVPAAGWGDAAIVRTSSRQKADQHQDKKYIMRPNSSSPQTKDNTCAPIVAKLVVVAARLDCSPRFYGGSCIRVEHAVYAVFDRLYSDHIGGYWNFLSLSNGGFFMALHADKLTTWQL